MQCTCNILSSVACPALQTFFTLSQKKGYQTQICVLISSTNSVLNISHSRKNWERGDQKGLVVFMWSTWFSCPVLMKFEFSWQFLKKYSYIKFHENPSSGSRVFPWGQTDRWTDMMKLIVTFSNFVNTPKKETWTQTDQTIHTTWKSRIHIFKILNITYTICGENCEYSWVQVSL